MSISALMSVWYLSLHIYKMDPSKTLAARFIFIFDISPTLKTALARSAEPHTLWAENTWTHLDVSQ